MKKNTNNEVKKNTIEKVEETKSQKMMLCLKAMAKNEKMIARLQKKIDNIKQLNEEIASKFKSLIDAE